MNKSIYLLFFAVFISLLSFSSCGKDGPTTIIVNVTVIIPQGSQTVTPTASPVFSATCTATPTPTRTCTSTTTFTQTYTSTVAAPAVQFTAPFDDSVYDQLGNTSGAVSVNYCDYFVPLSNGWIIYGDFVRSKIVVMNVLTGAVDTEIQLNAPPKKMDYNYSTGTLIVCLYGASSVAKVDMTSGTVAYINTLAPVKFLAVSGSGKIFAIHESLTYTSQTMVSAIDSSSGALLKTYLNYNYSGPAVYKDSTNQLIIAGSYLTRNYIDPSTNNITQLDSVSSLRPAGDYLPLSADEAHLLVQNSNLTNLLVDISPDNFQTMYGGFTSQYTLSASDISPDSSLAVAADNNYYISIYDLVNHARLHLFRLPAYSYSSLIRFSQGGRIIIMRANQYDINLPAVFYWFTYQP